MDFLNNLKGQRGSDLMMSLGVGLLSQQNLSQGLAQGFGQFQQIDAQRQNDAAKAQEMEALQGYRQGTLDLQGRQIDLSERKHDHDVEQARLKMEQGEWVSAGNGVMVNPLTGEEITTAAYDLYRRETEASIARDRAAVAQGNKPDKPSPFQQGGDYIDEATGEPYFTSFDPNTNQRRYTNAVTGQEVPNLPASAVPATQSSTRHSTKADATAFSDALDRATTAPQTIGQLETMKTLAQGNAGGTVAADVLRWMATRAGIELQDFDASDIEQVNQIASAMELKAAEAFKGQGQITENERLILRKSLPNIATNPDALNAVIDVFIKSEQRNRMTIDRWVAAPEEEKAQGFKVWRYKNADALYKETAPARDTGSASILDEADAIVGLTGAP